MRYMATAEAAEYLGFAEQTLVDWRAKGRGPKYIKVARSVRYAVADLDEWMGQQRRTPGGALA